MPTADTTRSSTTAGTPFPPWRPIALDRWEWRRRRASRRDFRAPADRPARGERRRTLTTGTATASPTSAARDRQRGLLVYAVDFGGVANLNTARLPLFARVDVRATWRPRGSAGRWELYAEVINLLNRKNAGALDCATRIRPRLRPAAHRESATSRFPAAHDWGTFQVLRGPRSS